MTDTAADIGHRRYGRKIETPRDPIEIVGIPIIVSFLAEKLGGVRSCGRDRIGHA